MVTRTKKIFVGGLSAPTTLEDVKSYFEQFGPVSFMLALRKDNIMPCAEIMMMVIIIIISIVVFVIHSFSRSHSLFNHSRIACK